MKGQSNYFHKNTTILHFYLECHTQLITKKIKNIIKCFQECIILGFLNATKLISEICAFAVKNLLTPVLRDRTAWLTLRCS